MNSKSIKEIFRRSVSQWVFFCVLFAVGALFGIRDTSVSRNLPASPVLTQHASVAPLSLSPPEKQRALEEKKQKLQELREKLRALKAVSTAEKKREAKFKTPSKQAFQAKQARVNHKKKPRTVAVLPKKPAPSKSPAPEVFEPEKFEPASPGIPITKLLSLAQMDEQAINFVSGISPKSEADQASSAVVESIQESSPEIEMEQLLQMPTLGRFKENSFAKLRKKFAWVKEQGTALDLTPFRNSETPKKSSAPMPELVRPKSSPVATVSQPESTKKVVQDASEKKKQTPPSARLQTPVDRAPSEEVVDARSAGKELAGDWPELIIPENTSSEALNLVDSSVIEGPQLEVANVDTTESNENEDSTLVKVDVAPGVSATYAVTTHETVAGGYSKLAETSRVTSTLPQTAAVKTPTEPVQKDWPRGLPKPRTAASSIETAAISTAVATTQSDAPLSWLRGDLVLEKPVEEWLESRKGHVEVYLYPKESRNASDVVFAEYQYPEKRFEVDLRDLKGDYKLVAGFYTPKSASPAFQVVHDKIIDTKSVKKKIIFEITGALAREAQRRVAEPKGLLLSLSVFTVAEKLEEETPIPGASVQLVGHPEAGVRLTGAEGNIRIEDIPSGSEYLVKVSAPGYFPTFEVIPIFGEDTYTAVHLLPKSLNSLQPLMESIGIRDLGSDPTKGIVLGRIFDSKKQPMGNREVGITFQRGIQRSSVDGMFGFAKLAPSIRFIKRDADGSHPNPVLLTQVRPNSATYVEFGRSGARALQGVIEDPFQGGIEGAVIRIVGERRYEEKSQRGGQFVIPSLDLPDGLVTLEVEAPGYPLAWYTLPWRVLRKTPRRTLYIMDEGLIFESFKSISRAVWDSRQGAILGGAEAQLFSKNNHCVYVELLDDVGRALAKVHGPYPILGDSRVQEGPLCLTREKPGFSFLNLQSGEYILNWKNRQGATFRSHILRVGAGRVSFAVN